MKNGRLPFSFVSALTLVLVAFSVGRAQVGERYLIITHDNFYDAIQPLAQWKHKKGMVDTVVRASAIGTNPAAIQAFIRTAYTTWNPRPEFVLLVGSGFHIPAFQHGSVYSDNDYGNMTGSYVMEIPVGRFPCKTARQCSTMVAKTLAYERNPNIVNDQWFRRLTTIVREENNPGNDAIYWADARYAAALAAAAGYAAVDSFSSARSHSASNVIQSLNNGSAFVLYRGGASGYNWNSPFNVNPADIDSTGRPPIVFSGTAQTLTLGPSSMDSAVANAWLAVGTKDSVFGAAAFIGCTDPIPALAAKTCSLSRGFFSAVFPESTWQLGTCLLRAKARLPVADSALYRAFNLLGDPELNLWSRRPSPLQVRVDTTALDIGSVTITVRRTPDTLNFIRNALVCVRDAGTTCKYGYTDSLGVKTFSFSPPPGPLDVTTTARNYLPFEGQQVVDVSATAIVSPLGEVDSASLMLPGAIIRNNGFSPQLIWLKFTIPGIGYVDSMSYYLHPGSPITRYFRPETLHARGPHTAKCSTRLGNDQVPGNNLASASFYARVRDVATVAILSPKDTIPHDTVVTPAAWFRNNGTNPARFRIAMNIGQDYARVDSLNLNSGEGDTFAFPAWTAAVAGWQVVRCSSGLYGDLKIPNNWLSESLFVEVRDVTPNQVVWPAGATVGNTENVPQARIRNQGNTTQNVRVIYRIADSLPIYVDTEYVSMPPLSYRNVLFTPWTPPGIGDYTTRVLAWVSSDTARANDSLAGTFTVIEGKRDAGVTAVTAPGGAIDTTPLRPSCVVRNTGTIPVAFYVHCDIYDSIGTRVYADSNWQPELDTNATASMLFATWTRRRIGRYSVRSYASLLGDFDAGNDTARGGCRAVINPLPLLDWVARPDIPFGPWNKKVKDGASLAYRRGVEDKASDSTMLFLFKGNGTPEFYQYETLSATWTSRQDIPLYGMSGKKKGVKKGASLTSAGDYLYGTKGNNSLEFWRFDPTKADSAWYQMPDVPIGAKAIKEGSGLTTVNIDGRPFIYLLKGSATTEFYRYSVDSNRWETRLNAPSGYSGKGYKNGSCVTNDGSGTIYALKASYNEFYRYDIYADTWTTMKNLPLIGTSKKKKKVKDGAGLAYLNGIVFALKGGNTYEFWAYRLQDDSWTQIKDVPIGGGRRVKGGGSLVATDNCLYATKGNNSYEFYCVTIPADFFNRTPRSNTAVQSSLFNLHSSIFTLRVSPNPLAFRNPQSPIRISYSLPQPGNASVKLYDITGALVMTLAEGYRPAGAYTISVNPRTTAARLQSGIYLLKLESGAQSTSTKLVVQ